MVGLTSLPWLHGVSGGPAGGIKKEQRLLGGLVGGRGAATVSGPLKWQAEDQVIHLTRVIKAQLIGSRPTGQATARYRAFVWQPDPASRGCSCIQPSFSLLIDWICTSCLSNAML